MSNSDNAQSVERLPRPEAAKHLLDECRMVLPGIQALFGFQLIAVFNERFARELLPAEQWLHLLAIALVAIAMAMLMAPAAYHRQTSPEHMTDHFIGLCSRLLMAGLLPLALALCLDFFLVGHVITRSAPLAAVAALALLAVFFGLWLFLPWQRRRQTGPRPLP